MAGQRWRIGLAGLGTVGGGVVDILNAERDTLYAKTNCYLDIVAVAARDKTKKRGVTLPSDVVWVDGPQALATHPAVDVVVEVMGGDGDPALSLVRACLQARRPVVTANKSLLARHGMLLAQLAKDTATPLMYEAAVAGGIPIIKMIREGLAANTITGLYGILNGTCNYILTTMEKTGRDFDGVLADAQRAGYAEADPRLDVDGGDSGHKLALLAALAHGCPVPQSFFVDGIRAITADDILAAREFGYRIKLIGQSTLLPDGRMMAMVAPSLVPLASPLAHVDGVLNGVAITSNFAGASFIAGRGAGAHPTASAVVADLVDIAKGCGYVPVFGRDMPDANVASASFDDWQGAFYLRLKVKDQPGVLADIAPVLRDHAISVESLVQRGQSAHDPVNIIMMTHDSNGAAVRHALAKLSHLSAVMEKPLAMPVLAI